MHRIHIEQYRIKEAIEKVITSGDGNGGHISHDDSSIENHVDDKGENSDPENSIIDNCDSDEDNSRVTDFGDTEEITCDIPTYREIAKDFYDLGLYNSSLFLLDKVTAFSDNHPEDVYNEARCFHSLGKYHSALTLLKSTNLHRTNPHCRYMYAKCLYEIKEYADALSVLNNDSVELLCPNEEDPVPENVDPLLKKLYCSMLTLKGDILEAMENRSRAAACYKQALFFDVTCFSALQKIVERCLFTKMEIQQLLDSLPWEKGNKLHLLTLEMYKNLLSHQMQNKENESKGLLTKFEQSIDLKLAKAEKLYYICNFVECLEITKSVLSVEPYNMKCIQLHVCCLMELGEYNKLFHLAHTLIDTCPDDAISWYIVGCYYFMNGKQEIARKYIQKCISKNQLYGPAWLLYGHTFSCDNEHDQAMTSYLKASEIMIENHLPILYIGIECSFNNNVDVALKFLEEALKLCPKDPFVLHEMSVILYNIKKYKEAENVAQDALNLVKEIYCASPKWEPVYNNLGHIYRKLEMYDKALEYYEQALIMCPLNPTTLSYIGFIHVLSGNMPDAIDVLNRALIIRPKDVFTTTLLNHVIEHIAREETPMPCLANISKIGRDFSISHPTRSSTILENTMTEGKSVEMEITQSSPDVDGDQMVLDDSRDELNIDEQEEEQDDTHTESDDSIYD